MYHHIVNDCLLMILRKIEIVNKFIRKHLNTKDPVWPKPHRVLIIQCLLLYDTCPKVPAGVIALAFLTEIGKTQRRRRLIFPFITQGNHH